MQNYSRESSFTLMELLIVIAVIAILAAIVLVSLDNARQSANESRGMQFYQNIRTAIANDLVGEWSFDSQSNPGAGDIGNGNNGTLINMEPEDWVSGKVRGALQFDGVDEYVNIPNYPAFNINGDMTVSMWFKPIAWSTTTEGQLLYNNLYQFYYRGGWAGRRIYFMIRKTTSGGSGDPPWSYWAGVWTPNELDAQKWYYLVGVRSGDKMSFWVNGTKVRELDALAGQTVDNSQITNLTIGRGVWGFFNSVNDEVRIYKAALSTKQIQQIYAEGRTRHMADCK